LADVRSVVSSVHDLTWTRVTRPEASAFRIIRSDRFKISLSAEVRSYAQNSNDPGSNSPHPAWPLMPNGGVAGRNLIFAIVILEAAVELQSTYLLL
jgi:hypothetical protein